jgi:uncharacterized membrane protein YdfJ with MMPL/SSD domain
MVLAATFGALSVLPLLFLGQLAFLVGFGVLLDTFVVRSLVVPAAVRLIGDSVWWPSKLARGPVGQTGEHLSSGHGRARHSGRHRPPTRAGSTMSGGRAAPDPREPALGLSEGGVL